MPVRAVLTAAIRVMDRKRPLREFHQCPVQGVKRLFGFEGVPRMVYT
jgi:hypothetical protein